MKGNGDGVLGAIASVDSRLTLSGFVARIADPYLEPTAALTEQYKATMDTQVLIVGAGPTGLTLAIDLGLRGVRCTVIEQKEAPQFLPKMERCNARTMEIYRRMGIADQVRAAGLPAALPDGHLHRAVAGRAAAGASLHPSVAEAKAQIAQVRGRHEPLEPYQLISQYTLEPLLKSIAETLAERHRALRLRVRVLRAG